MRICRLMRVRWTPCLDGTFRSGTWAIIPRRLAHVWGLTIERGYPSLDHKRSKYYFSWKVHVNQRSSMDVERAFARMPRPALSTFDKRSTSKMRMRCGYNLISIRLDLAIVPCYFVSGDGRPEDQLLGHDAYSFGITPHSQGPALELLSDPRCWNGYSPTK